MLPSHRGRDTPIRSEGSDDYPSAALSLLSRDGYRPAWQVAGGQATLSVPAVPRGGRAHVSPGVCLRRSVSCHQATNRGYGHERQWHSRYGAGVTHQPDHSHKRMKKKEPELEHVHQALLQHLHPEHVEVEICRAEEWAHRRGLTSELDEMWSDVGKKAEPRWRWHAIDHHSGTVLAYVFGRRKEICRSYYDSRKSLYLVAACGNHECIGFVKARTV